MSTDPGRAATAARGTPGGRLQARLGRCLVGLAVGGLVALGSSGCGARAESHLRPLPERLPVGSPLLSTTLEEGDAWARHHLMLAEYGEAIDLLGESPAAPRDRLVRSLQQALVLHRAGDHAGSNTLLEWAEVEADRRYTRSVTRGIASLGLGDGSLAYAPTPSELAMVPFYRMLNYLALGEMEGALVESRKANALAAAGADGSARECGEHAMLSYLAGVVQMAGGETNDALVSLRVAEAAFEGCGAAAPVRAPASLGEDLYRAARAAGVSEIADSAAARYGLEDRRSGPGGDVLLVIEEGFVSHRSAEALHVPIFPEDVEGLDGGDADGVAAAAARVTARLVSNLTERAAWGTAVDDLQWAQWASALDGAYILRLAWPASRREASVPSAVRVLVGDSLAGVETVGEISSLVERDLEAQRPAMVARLVARGLAKYLVTREVEQRAGERGGEVAAFLAGRVANAAVNQLERADTRSWSLLPDRVSLARLRLPPGRHHIRIETLGADGLVVRSHDLGEVDVADGGLVALSSRVWAN